MRKILYKGKGKLLLHRLIVYVVGRTQKPTEVSEETKEDRLQENHFYASDYFRRMMEEDD